MRLRFYSFRHKGRIERLRVLLAYGFEARTQHQLSSSRHAAARHPFPHTHTHTRKHRHTARHQPKGDLNVVSFHGQSNCLDHNEFVHHLALDPCACFSLVCAAST